MTEATIITRRASCSPSSWNEKTRTFVAVLSTGAPVARQDARGAFDEVLSLEQQWPDRVPLLDSHSRDSVNSVLGHVSNIRVEGGQLIGDATLSAHNETSKRLAAELSDGQTFGVSIGYRVQNWRDATANGKRQKIAERFQLLECSLVPIGADGGAGIRSEMEANMPDNIENNETTTRENRAQVNQQIRSIGELAGLSREWCDEQIDADASLEQARAAAFEQMKTRKPTKGVRTAVSVGASYDDPAVRREAMADAMFTRIDPSHTPSESARQFTGYSLVDCARDLLSSRGVSTLGLSPNAIVTRAMGGPAMSTSDLPLLLADVMNKVLRQAYSAAPSGIKRAARATTNRDFRAKHHIQVSGPLTLEETTELGEFRHGAFVDAEESYKLKTFGKIVGFSRQMIVNDSLGALSDPARYLGRAAAEFEASTLAALLASNPRMSDTKAMFHADHGNLAETGAAISSETLSAARLALRTQKGLSGELIACSAKYLLVGADRETEAEKILHTLVAQKVEDQNVWQNRLELVVEPRMSTAWYVAADPNEAEGIEYCHLEGEGGPQIMTELGFDVDAIRFRIRLDFGAGAIDWRGWYKNAGASA